MYQFTAPTTSRPTGLTNYKFRDSLGREYLVQQADPFWNVVQLIIAWDGDATAYLRVDGAWARQEDGGPMTFMKKDWSLTTLNEELRLNAAVQHCETLM